MKYAPAIFIALITLGIADIAIDIFSLWSMTWGKWTKFIIFIILGIPYLFVLPGILGLLVGKANMALSTGKLETYKTISVIGLIGIAWTLWSIPKWLYDNWEPVTGWIVYICIITIVMKCRMYYIIRVTCLDELRKGMAV